MWYHPPNTVTVSQPYFDKENNGLSRELFETKVLFGDDKWADKGRLPQGGKTRKKWKGAEHKGEGRVIGGGGQELDLVMVSRSLLHFNSIEAVLCAVIGWESEEKG